MGREQMRNLEITKIGATQVTEFDYQKNQGEMTEQEHPGQQGRGGERMTAAERVKQVTAAAHKKVEKRRKKEGVKSSATKKAAKTTKTTTSKKAVKSKKAHSKKAAKATKKKR